jgi:malonyl-CoA O-methyltransferase
MREAFSRAAAHYDEAAVLARETGRRLAERLDWVKLTPQCVADIGCASGDGVRELQRRYPGSQAIAVDFSPAMLDATRVRAPTPDQVPLLVNADARALPLAAGSIDLAWSNLVLHWLDDPLPAFLEIRRTLAVGGLFSFAMLGPDTLKELRVAGAKTVRRFIDMHDIGDMLVAAGFAEPVMDMEVITLSYRRAADFLADQRHLGVRDGLLGQLSWRQARQVFRAWRRTDDGRLPATFEIVFGHAWKGEATTSDDGRSVVRFHRQ